MTRSAAHVPCLALLALGLPALGWGSNVVAAGAQSAPVDREVHRVAEPASEGETAPETLLERWRAARAAGTSEEVDRRFYPLFLDASRAGDPRATLWCLEHPGASRPVAVETASPPAPEEVAARAALLRRLVDQVERMQREHVETDPQADRADEVLQRLRLDRIVLREGRGLLGYAAARDLLESLERRYVRTPLRWRLALARAELMARPGCTDDERLAAASRLFSELSAAPDAWVAQTARDSLWRLENLWIGKAAPDFCSRDAAGNDVCLSHHRGRVILVRFWSFDDPGVEETMLADRALVQTLWDEPFELIAVNRDVDREEYLRRVEELGVEGTQIYEGPVAADLHPEVRARHAALQSAFHAWRQSRSGGVYLLDASGRVRGVDVPSDEAEARIRELVAERYARDRAAATGTSSDGG